MRRTLLLMALTAVTASALTAAAVAMGSGSSGLTAPATVHVIEHPITDQVIDIGAKGDSPGDQLPFALDRPDAGHVADRGSAKFHHQASHERIEFSLYRWLTAGFSGSVSSARVGAPGQNGAYS